ncbi:hypothetical protein C8F01DRAFT_1107536 [Mycena amicta]|nr:hypothetical protein C8F01DRAFT_1107536 [Mycena amicta]
MYRTTATLFIRHTSSLATKPSVSVGAQNVDPISAKLAELLEMKDARRAARLAREMPRAARPLPSIETTPLPEPPVLQYKVRPPLELQAQSTTLPVQLDFTPSPVSPAVPSSSMEAPIQRITPRAPTSFTPRTTPSSAFVRGGSSQQQEQNGNKRPRRNRGPRQDSGDQEQESGWALEQEIEEWLDNDNIHLARFRGPDVPLRNLSTSLHSESSSPVRSPRETMGGDYSRLVPANPQQYIAAAKKLGAIKHSFVVVAHQRDVPTENRLRVKNVVGSVGRKVPS